MPRKTKAGSAQTCVFIAAIAFCCAFFPPRPGRHHKTGQAWWEVATYMDSKSANVDFQLHIKVNFKFDRGKNSIFFNQRLFSFDDFRYCKKKSVILKLKAYCCVTCARNLSLLIIWPFLCGFWSSKHGLTQRKRSQSQCFVCTVDFKFGGGSGSFPETKGPALPRMGFL